ncbi:hypothetical protein NIES25_56160 (plasmid) [Nostoc linckia NIES-25]|nr:hypothetical protein NIES25_56160 [Nostoc linckia NIES-25]
MEMALILAETIRLLAEVGKRGRGKGKRFGIFPFPFNMSPFPHKSAFCTLEVYLLKVLLAMGCGNFKQILGDFSAKIVLGVTRLMEKFVV